MISNGIRLCTWALGAALLLAAGGCAVTPDMRPPHVRKFAEAPVQQFTSVTLVFMPVPRPAQPAMAAEYDRMWRSPETWRAAYFRRLQRNFAHNGIDLQVFDAGVAGRTVIEPTTLQVRMTAEGIILDSGWLRFAMRGEASNRDTRYVAFNHEMYISRFPERSANRETYLILNALRDAGLIKPPTSGKDYSLASSD